MSNYMYQHTRIPSFWPMPRFLISMHVSNTAKLLYSLMLGRAQLSQSNAWVDGNGRVYFVYTIQQMAEDMEKSATTIKDAMKELVAAHLLEKVPQGRGRPNRLYILFPEEKVCRKSDVGNSTEVGWKTGSNPVGNVSPNKYINNKTNNSLRDYDYEEEESF